MYGDGGGREVDAEVVDGEDGERRCCRERRRRDRLTELPVFRAGQQSYSK